MKIIHTADWHLGQSFFEYDRKMEHIRFLLWLKDVLQKYDADVLLIAGDVFDTTNPSAESQKLYYSFLREVTAENPNLQVIIIAGNHDSAGRLEAPNPLLEGMNVWVRGIVKRNDDGQIDFEHLIIPLHIGGYCLAVPYLRQGDYPDAGNYSLSVKALYDKLYLLSCAETTESRTLQTELQKPLIPVIAMGHLHATGAETSENDRSERTVIGGLEHVSPDAFSAGIAYTALGHLHRGQKISGSDNIRYAGAPIPMSFAEKNNKQGVVLVDISNNTTHVERILYEGAVELLSIPSEPMRIDDAILEISKLPAGEITDSSPYLEIKVLITEPEPSMRHRIEQALKGKAVRLARISAVTPENSKENIPITTEELLKISPIDMAEKIFEQQYGGEKMPETLKKLLLEVLQEINE